MGREAFTELLKNLEVFGNKYGQTTLSLYGFLGFGGSHLLAALTCSLIKAGKRVVFFPAAAPC